MIRFLKLKILYLIPVVAIVILVLLTWLNYAYVEKVPGGGEFFVNWHSTRGFILDGTSPYSSEATQNIQDDFAKTGLKSIPADQAFASPFYAIFLYASFGLIKDFSLARALWMTILEVLLLFTSYKTISIFSEKTPILISIAVGVFSVFSLQSYNALNGGSATIISMSLLLFSILAIRRGKDEIAGLLLALSTMQFAQSWIFLMITLAWVGIKRRTRILSWFFAVLVLLFGFSILLIPDWIIQFASGLYLAGQGQPAALQTELTKRLILVFDIILLLILAVEWFLANRRNSVNLIWLFMLTMVVTSWLLSASQPNILVMSIPPFFYSLLLLQERWGEKSHYVIFLFVGLVFIVYWVVYLFTSIGGKTSGINVISWILPLVTLMLLYWSRWWLIYSPLAKPTENKILL